MPLVFRKQPSGGRGEYELVGESNGTSSFDLLEHGFVWETPFGLKETEVALSNQGGKRRLRLTAPGIQIHRQAAALALLPRSIRDENRVSDGRPIMLQGRYILDVVVALVSINGGMATVRPEVFTARSGPAYDTEHKIDIDAQSRLARVERLWLHTDDLPERVRIAVLAHRASVMGDSVIGQDAEKAVRTIVDRLIEVDAPQYIPGADPLPALEFLAGLAGAIDLPPPPEAPHESPEIRRRLESEYRQARTRGASASNFKRAVQKAYRFRCAFCGFRALDVPGLARSGVDAAHILPWGQYDLDVVQNGLLLCKRDHWAFDAHVLLLSFDNGRYVVKVNPFYEEQITDRETIGALNEAVGEVPDTRLPSSKADWPNPEFIQVLYRGLPEVEGAPGAD